MNQEQEGSWNLILDIGNLWRGTLLFLATLFSHWQAIGGGFIWDDDAHVTKEALRSLDGLWAIWFKLGATQQYYPLVHSIFWFEHALWGDAASYYHIVNILLHTVVAFLLVAVLRKLEMPGAWLAGFVFALHPVHVESVAWITEQKNTISALFYFATALFYLRFLAQRERKLYFLALGFFVLALLSKTVTATLPAALLVILWWKNGRISWRKDVIPLIPFFILGIAGGCFTAWVERVYIGAQGVDYLSAVTLTPVTRVLLAGHVLWFYIGKLLWPVNLIFIYEHWNLSASNPVDYVYTLGILVILGVLFRIAVKGFNARGSDTYSRAPLAGFLFFCGTLFPVLGFANVYPFMFSYVADHFQYLGSIGILVPLCAAITLSFDRLSHENRGMASAIGGVFIALLGFLSWNQCSIYTDAETLYKSTITRNPSCWMAHNNLGAIWLNAGRIAEATEQFQAAISIRKNYPDAQSNMCGVLIKTGHYKEAVEHAELAVALRPGSPQNENNLAIALAGVGRTQEAIEHYKISLKIMPNFVEALNNLANAYMTIGRKQDALECYQTAIKYSPNFPDAYSNLALLLMGVGHTQEAAGLYEKAVQLIPNNFAYRTNLGLCYSNLGRQNEAIAQFGESLKLNQNVADTWFYLANSYITLGRYAESESPLLNVLKLNPAHQGAENNIAAVYYRLGRMPEAVSHYQSAIRMNPNYAEAHSNLGVALVSEKFIDDGIAEYTKAIQLRPDYGDAYNNLALALATQGKHVQAVEYYKKAVTYNDKNPEYFENYARSLKALGKLKESDSQIAAATKLRTPIAAQAGVLSNQSGNVKQDKK